MTCDTRDADGTRCEGCKRTLVPGDLVAFATDPPGSCEMCSNPPVCAECIVSWADEPHHSWVRNLAGHYGVDFEWVRIV